MTCIVGYEENGNVYIGGDSAEVAGSNIVSRSDEKVFRKNDMIFGFTSSFRMGQLIEYCLHIPSRNENISDYHYLVRDFIPSLIKCFSDGGFLTKKDGASKGGTFLLGYRGNLYIVGDDFQIGKSNNSFNTCGCGFAYARGAMTILDDLPLSPEQKVTKALEAAAKHSGGVEAPFKIINLHYRN